MSVGGPQQGSGWPPGQVKWVSEEQVRQVLTWEQLIPAVTHALQSYSRGSDHPQGAVQPLRFRVNVPQHQGTMLAMPGMVTGVSLLSRCSLGIPTTQPAASPLAHPSSCSCTRTRVSQQRNEEKEGKLVVAVLGAGAQARSHAHVMAHVLNVDKVIVWARRSEAAEELCQMLRSESIPATAAATVQQAVAAADVINCCTSTSTPLLQARWVKPGAHINSIGAASPNKQELEKDLVRSAIIYTDSYEAAMKESGDIIATEAEVYAEIGEVLLGTKPLLADKITIFKSLGLAVEDAVSAQLVFDALSAEEE